MKKLKTSGCLFSIVSESISGNKNNIDTEGNNDNGNNNVNGSNSDNDKEDFL